MTKGYRSRTGSQYGNSRRPRQVHSDVKKRVPGVTAEDFHIVDDFIDSVSPAYEAENNRDIKRARRAWGKILLKYG